MAGPKSTQTRFVDIIISTIPTLDYHAPVDVKVHGLNFHSNSFLVSQHNTKSHKN